VASSDSDLVDSLRTTISGARLPSGVAAHLAGAVAINADQSKQSGSNGSTVWRCLWYSSSPCCC